MLEQDLEKYINSILEHHGLKGFKCKILTDKIYFICFKGKTYIFMYKDVESILMYKGENLEKKQVKESLLYENIINCHSIIIARYGDKLFKQ
jgi:hypothetical protein